jgi:hypothetical protein
MTCAFILGMLAGHQALPAEDKGLLDVVIDIYAARREVQPV